MKITHIDCHVLVDPDFDPAATSSAQDSIVVEVHTDEGIVGIGESDVNPWIARACIESPGTHTMDVGLKKSLIGADPSEISKLWRTMYQSTAMPGRRGAMVHAIGAIDIALWDIAGKAASKPVWELLGKARNAPVQAYASLEPEVADFDLYTERLLGWARQAKGLGFPAVKLEVTFSGPYANMGLNQPDERILDILLAARSELGPDMAIMVDAQYAFDSVDRAARVINSWEPVGLAFVEAPVWIDDVKDYAELGKRVVTPLAAGEWNSTRYEFRELIEEGNLHILQPDVGRVGGISEMMIVAELAQADGRKLVPHAWKSGITLAATAHVATVTECVSYIEFLHPQMCESRIRKELVTDEIELTTQGVSVPQRAGLGVDLNRDALDEFAAAAIRMY